MSDPASFTTVTPNLALPMLVPGQAQKEFFVNHAFCVLDALQSRGVAASLAAPPSLAQEGDCFRVTGPATQAWQGHEDHVAVRIGGGWHFAAPREGMALFDRASGHLLVYRSGWQKADAPTLPSGGGVIDAQARAAIQDLTHALKALGLLA